MSVDSTHARANTIHKGAYIQSADPGAVGAKVLWIDTTSGYVLKKRKDDDTGWDTIADLGAIGAIITTLSQNINFSGDISPAQITADQNDYNPTGLSTASTLRLNSDAARNITGLQGGADGRLLAIHNIGSQNIVLKDESASSSAANRFALNTDVTMGADQSVLLQYDSTSSRWRLIAGPTSGGGASIAPLVIEDANTVAQRNTTNAQAFYIYKTFTSSTNYERLALGWDGVGLRVGAEKGSGGGSALTLRLVGQNRTLNFNDSGLVPTSDNNTPLGGNGARFSQAWIDDIIASSRIRFFSGGNNKGEIATTSSGKSIYIIDGATGNPGTIRFPAHTPSQFGANQNNYTEEGGNNHGFLRWSSDASRDVTGLSLSQTDGEVHLIVNVGSNNIVLKHEDANSSAANRFLCSTGADITLGANQAADVIYDGTTQRWRVFKRN